MNRDDQTQMGGQDDGFHTTHWTEIIGARAQDESRRIAALNQLVSRYWRPVYCYLRQKGHDRESAKDLTQGFFHEVVLSRGLVRQADRARGRFRNLLLTALNNYVKSVRRAQTAKKRAPAEGLASLDAMDLPDCPELRDMFTPEDAYHYAWACSLLDGVLSELEKSCRRNAQAVHWEVFCAHLLKPIMEDAEAPPLAELCARHGIADKAKASNMIVTVKRQFERLLRRQVRQLVDADEEVEQEIVALMQILSRSGAG